MPLFSEQMHKSGLRLDLDFLTVPLYLLYLIQCIGSVLDNNNNNRKTIETQDNKKLTSTKLALM